MAQQQYGPPAAVTGSPGPPSALFGQSTAYFQQLRAMLIGVPCALLVLCTAAVAGRLTARRIAKVGLEADDFVAILALVGTVVYRRILLKRRSFSSLPWLQRESFVCAELRELVNNWLIIATAVAHYMLNLSSSSTPNINDLQSLGKVGCALTHLIDEHGWCIYHGD